ncbi:beta-2 adrenergic receptor-like [Asterias amurensis]|uniref:beta-2 adrenergic receptor-like n=1 Tax=Asterias amurensis TaxID=7602 RepID=UPI003AB7CC26
MESNTVTSWDVFLCVLFGLMAFCIISGNIFCLVVLRGVNSVHQSTKAMMASLSVADLGFGVFVVLPVIGTVAVGAMPYGMICKIFAFAVVFFPRAGIACILVINVDRFIAISRPLHYFKIVNTRRAVFAVVIAWSIALLLTCLLAFLPGSDTVYHGQFHTCFFTRAVSSKSSSTYLVGVILIVVSIALPILVSTVLYALICRIARRHTDRMTVSSGGCVTVTLGSLSTSDTGSNKGSTSRPSIKSNTKAAKTFFIVTAGFVIAWLPFLIILMYEGLENTVVPRWLADLALIAVFSSSWWNVVIFYVRNAGFRKRAMQLLRLRRG